MKWDLYLSLVAALMGAWLLKNGYSQLAIVLFVSAAVSVVKVLLRRKKQAAGRVPGA